MSERVRGAIPLVISASLIAVAVYRYAQTADVLSSWVPYASALGIIVLAAGLVRYRSKIYRAIGRGYFKITYSGRADLLKILKIRSVSLIGNNVIKVRSGSSSRLFALIRLTGRPSVPDSEVGTRGMAGLSQYQNLFQKLRNFISGLQKCGLPVVYSVCLHPIPPEGESSSEREHFSDHKLGRIEEREVERLQVGERFGFFKTDVLVLTGVTENDPSVIEELNSNVRSILASILTAFPEMEAKRLNGMELVEALQLILSGSIEGQVLIAPEVASLLPPIAPTPSSMSHSPEPEFNLPDPKEVFRRGPLLGWVMAYGRRIYKVNLSLDSFPMHTTIFGMTGSGKSTTAGTIIVRADEFGMKALIFDWHNEYRGLVLSRGGLVFTPGRGVAPLTVNPFDPSLTTDLNEHISLVTDIFAYVFDFTDPQSFMFMEATTLAYKHSQGTVPTISTILSEIEQMPIRSKYDRETKLALFRRLKPLTEGQAGEALNGQSTVDLDTIMKNLVSIELGHFKEQRVRKIFISILLKLIYDYRTRRPTPSVNHITLVEEARNITPPRQRDAEPTIGERITSELRKFGECIVSVAQFPSQISNEVLKNAAIRICHQLKTADDQMILRGAMRLNEEQSAFLHNLKPGCAIIDLPSMDDPFVVYIDPAHDVGASRIGDDELAKAMQKFSFRKDELEIRL